MPSTIAPVFVRLIASNQLVVTSQYLVVSGVGIKPIISAIATHQQSALPPQSLVNFVSHGKTHNREPSGLELWKITHVRKEGGYVNNTDTRNLMEAADAKIAERDPSSDESRMDIETEFFNEIMYSDDDPSSRVGKKAKVPTFLVPATQKVWMDIYTFPVPGFGGKTCAQIFEEAGCDTQASPGCAACVGGLRDICHD